MRTGPGPEFGVAAGWTVRSHWLCDFKRCLAKGPFWEGRTVKEEVLSARLSKARERGFCGLGDVQRNKVKGTGAMI